MAYDYLLVFLCLHIVCGYFSLLWEFDVLLLLFTNNQLRIAFLFWLFRVLCFFGWF